MEGDQTLADGAEERLTLYVGDEDELFERARRSTRPTELVVSPVELHQRNIQRRLREKNLSKDAFSFEDPVQLSIRLLESTERPTTTIDRIDRLTLLRSILAETTSQESSEIPFPPRFTSREPQQVEQIRTEVETVTNFHPERVAAWRDTADELDSPIDATATELLDTALGLERGLRERTSKAVSETELVRRATRSLMATDGSVWERAYPRIERLTLLGLSTLSAPHTDLVHGILATTTVEVHIHFRSESGVYLEDRAGDLLAVTDPGTEVFE
ncbi:hypothetical protein [Halorubrum sp. DTA98]|uniref:hypothetical protein n=1 Tax=Halorubrum sp. DTA98 TaxID=3402163 RepID=UPI003AAF2713